MVYVYLLNLAILIGLATYLIFSPKVKDSLIERLGLVALIFTATAEAYQVIVSGEPGSYLEEVALVGFGLVVVASLQRVPKAIKRSDGPAQ